MNHSSNPLAYRIDDACQVLGLGRTSLFKLIADGKLSSIKIGGRRLIPYSALERLIAEAARHG